MARLFKKKGDYVVTDLSLNQTSNMYLECDSRNYIDIDIRVVDNRHISDQQRKFIFALCNEISYYTGDDSEYIRLLLQQYNANLREIEVESLSSCSMSYANKLIDTIIDYCIEKEIPISTDVIKGNEYRFTNHQIYMMCLKRICAVCGSRADIHHVDTVGMGINRNHISHVGKKAIPLCRKHHTEIHQTGNKDFMEKYHIEPIEVDEKMDYFIKRGKLRIDE